MKIPYPAVRKARTGGHKARARMPITAGNRFPHREGKPSNISRSHTVGEALQIEKEKFHSVIDAMTDTLTVLNRDFDITFQNERSSSSFGDHVGEKCYRAYEHREKPCEDCPVVMAFRDGKPHTSEKKNLRPSGEVAFWENTANPVRDAGGDVVICLEIGRDVTKRKNSEKALQESQKFATSLLENSPHATVVINADTSVRYVNPAWERLNGWTLAEVVGLKAPYPWWPEEIHNDEFIPVYLDALRQPVGNGEIVALKRNGESYWIDMNWVSIWQDGEFQYAIVNSVDITERKKAEEKRQATINTALDGFWINDQRGKFLEVNDSYCEMTGYTREELLKMSIMDIEAIENPDETVRRIKKIVERGGDRFETKHKCKDGRIIDIEVSIRYLNIGEGQFAVFVRDITGRKKSQKALAESEEKFSKAFQSSPSRIAITSLKDGRYIDVNDSYLSSTGYSRQEVLGKTSKDINIWVHPEDRTKMLDIVREQGIVRNREFEFRMKSGETRTWLFSAQPITINGEPCLMGVATDISERKLMEKSLSDEAIRRRILIEQSRDGIVVLDENGAVYEANRRFAEMLGYSPEEVLKLNVWDWEFLYPPEKVREMISTVDEAGDHFETKHRRKDGSIYDVEISTNGATVAGQKLIFCVCRDITERKRAEEKRLAILQTALDGFCITDLHGKFIEVNDAYCTITGYTREEMLKLSIYDLEEHFTQGQIDELAELIVENSQFRGETRYRRKDGRIVDVEISSRYLNSGESQVYSFIHDITNRKKAEKALKESEEKFSKAFQASPGSISISRVSDGKLIEVNESFLRDKGYTRDEVIGRSAPDLHIWENIEDRQRIIKVLRQGKKVRNEVLQYRTKAGALRTGLISAEKINIGNEPCVLILNTDITEQKKAEEQLRLLSSVTQQVTDSIMITDPKFKIIYMNKAAQDMFGYSFDEVKGKYLSSFDVNPPSKKSNTAVRDVIHQGKVWYETIAKKRKDGRTIICDCRLSPLYDEMGNVTSYIDVQRDVTEQKEVELKLQAQNQLIENILATMLEGVLVVDAEDRVILANESAHQVLHRRNTTIKNKLLKDVIPVESLLNLYQRIKRGLKCENTLEFRYRTRDVERIIDCGAVRMDKERTLLTFTDVSREREEKERLYLTDRLASIGEMAVGLAHELNNPLTGILSLSQLLIDGDIPPESKEDLQCINSEAKRAAGIVKNVLVFTRNNTYENGQSSVNEVVSNVLRLREYEEKASNINVITSLQDGLPEVQIDQYQLQQVFLNLILNAEAAIKDAGRPGILSINTARAGTYVDVAITDNGCGIKKNVLPRIFDPFFTTKEIGKGTGLGLSICYGIISKRGGKINVSTRVNQGSTFTVRIPAVPE
jgi:PAS domain S-box-containing protein